MAEDGTMLEIAQNYVDAGLVLESLCLIPSESLEAVEAE
jgi:polar amino acid transport system substrate-binding protein